MTDEEMIKLFNSVGRGVTEIFKQKYHGLCKVELSYGKQNPETGTLIIPIVLKVWTTKDSNVSLYDIEEFIDNYFEIKIQERSRLYVNKKSCP